MRDELIIVSFLKGNPPYSFTRSNWPLHVTIVRPFHCSKSSSELITALSVVASENKSFSTIGIAKEFFGPNHDVPVITLKDTNELLSLHEQAVQACGPDMILTGPIFNEYLAHVTEQKSGSISIGTKIQISSISLVYLHNDECQVLCTFDLA